MTLKRLGLGNYQTVIVLGAGATRGAGFVDGLRGKAPLPPLDTDFFEQLECLRTETAVEELIRFYRGEFGAGADLRMEAFFTQIEFLNMLHKEFKVDKGARVKAYEKAQGQFVRALCSLFNTFSTLTCGHHARLAGALRSGDAVVSFNYDTTVDSALRDRAGTWWRPEAGYVVPVTAGADQWHAPRTAGAPPANPIRLLKMHGSLNWRRDGQGIALTKPPYKPASLAIIPPMWNKPIAQDAVFRTVWKSARTALRGARVLIVCGYSLPATDLLAQALFRVEANAKQSETLRAVVVADPDRGAADRIVRVLGGAVRSTTIVLRLGGMADLAAFIGP